MRLDFSLRWSPRDGQTERENRQPVAEFDSFESGFAEPVEVLMGKNVTIRKPTIDIKQAFH
jgi:hypothetical protein